MPFGRMETQGRRRHNAKRALRPDEELLQVYARIVLRKPRRPLQRDPSGSTTSMQSTCSRIDP